MDSTSHGLLSCVIMQCCDFEFAVASIAVIGGKNLCSIYKAS